MRRGDCVAVVVERMDVCCCEQRLKLPGARLKGRLQLRFIGLYVNAATLIVGSVLVQRHLMPVRMLLLRIRIDRYLTSMVVPLITPTGSSSPEFT